MNTEQNKDKSSIVDIENVKLIENNDLEEKNKECKKESNALFFFLLTVMIVYTYLIFIVVYSLTS